MTNARAFASAAILSLLAGSAHAQYNQQGQNYPQQQGGYQQQQGGYQQQGGWDAAPAEYSDDLHRHAFHDGIEAARRDFAANLPPDPMRHEEFRHPRTPDGAREDYRLAYKRGYFNATEHLRHQTSPQAAPPPQAFGGGGWDAPPAEFADDLRRHAFHDGIEAARRDFEQHLQPNPNQHTEYLHPQVPYPARQNYRDAFKRGYFMAMQHMNGR